MPVFWVNNGFFISFMCLLIVFSLETLRKYPGLPMLNRECTENYHLPNSNLTIPRGTPILIPIFGIQRDPANFTDPLDYKPERFLEESTSSMAYMPFGEGPRHCIGK